MVIIVMRQSAFPIFSVTGRHVGFTAYDGLDTAGQGLLIKLHRPEQIAMICHGHRRHVEDFICWTSGSI